MVSVFVNITVKRKISNDFPALMKKKKVIKKTFFMPPTLLFNSSVAEKFLGIYLSILFKYRVAVCFPTIFTITIHVN